MTEPNQPKRLGANRISMDLTIQPGFLVRVVVEALDFEPLTTLEG